MRLPRPVAETRRVPLVKAFFQLENMGRELPKWRQVWETGRSPAPSYCGAPSTALSRVVLGPISTLFLHSKPSAEGREPVLSTMSWDSQPRTQPRTPDPGPRPPDHGPRQR